MVSGFSVKPAPRPSQSRLAVDAEPLDVGGDLLGRLAVERDDGDAEVDPVGALRVLGECLEALGARVVVRPHRAVAELLAAAGEGARDLRVEAGGDSEPSAHDAFSSSATHSMCGVWGNMSTGFTRRSL